MNTNTPTNDGGPSSPVPEHAISSGRTLRDDFAVAVLPAIVRNRQPGATVDNLAEGIAAYQIADGAMQARTTPWPPSTTK